MREVYAEIDEVKMTMVITNLVENAVKYNRDHGKVRVTINADLYNFYVSVEDTGVGIPQESLDKIYMEHGGGVNGFESYTVAWYMGVNRTKLDAVEKQGRKGIIITMGDEPLNPYLPARYLNSFVNGTEETDVETKELYRQASQKFDIFHIAVDSPRDCYQRYKRSVDHSFGQFLGTRYKVATIDSLAQVIEDCITESVNGVQQQPTSQQPQQGDGIKW